MSATSLRAAALRRSHVRNYVEFMLGEESSQYDVQALITELNASDDRDYESMTPANFWEIAKAHEFDANGMTDAALAKALKNSQTGWVVMTRTPDNDVQSFNVEPSGGDTPEAVEATLRKFMRFPEGTSIMVLPLVG